MSYMGAAANVVGGELQGWASLLDKWAMADAYQKQAQQQAGYRNQALRLFNPGAFGAQTMTQGVNQGAQERQGAYASANATPLSFEGPQGNTRAQDSAYTNMLGQARAQLGGYSDWGVQQAIKNLQTQEQLNQISNFAGGTANVFPLQMYAAQHSNDALSAAGQAISSLGGGAANYGQLFAGTPPTQGVGGAPTYYAPAGSQQPYLAPPMQGYQDAYGNWIPTNFNNMPTGTMPG